MRPSDHVTFEIDERSEIPLLGLIFGTAPMIPFALGAAAVWLIPEAGDVLTRLTLTWAGAVLCLLAGVRRGLSFRTPGGPRLAQIATMLWLFALAFGALVCPMPLVAAGLLSAGYVSIAVLDPAAAHRQEAPLFFARLRPPQMAVPVISLVVLALHIASGS